MVQKTEYTRILLYRGSNFRSYLVSETLSVSYNRKVPGNCKVPWSNHPKVLFPRGGAKFCSICTFSKKNSSYARTEITNSKILQFIASEILFRFSPYEHKKNFFPPKSTDRAKLCSYPPKQQLQGNDHGILVSQYFSISSYRKFFKNKI